MVRLVGNASIETEGAGAVLVQDTIKSAQFENATVTVTGAPVLLKQINDYLKGGMLTLGAIAVVVMTIILLLLFNVRWRLLPLFVILIGVIWAFGLAGYLGIPLSLVTIAGLPVMLGIGIDYAIQMHARVEEEVVIDHAEHPIQETARNLCPALLVVTFDAVFAFLALRFAKVPMIRQFGLLLAVGIAVICFASIIVPLATLGIREFKSPTKAKDFREGFLGRLTVKLGSLPLWAGPVLAVASFAVFFGGLAVEDKLTLQTDPVQWVEPAARRPSRTSARSRRRPGRAPSSASSCRPTTCSQETRRLRERHDPAQHRPPRGAAARCVERRGHDGLPDRGARRRDRLRHARRTSGRLRRGPRGHPPLDGGARERERHPTGTVRAPTRALNIIFRYGPGSLEERKVVVNEIRDNADPPEGVSATPSGLAVVGVGLLENLKGNRTLLTYLAIAFVGLFLAIRLRSVVRSLLSLGAGAHRSGRRQPRRLEPRPQAQPHHRRRRSARGRGVHRVHVADPAALPRGAAPRPATPTGGRRRRIADRVGRSSCRASPRSPASPSSPPRSCRCCATSASSSAMNVAVALLSALIVLPPLLVRADQRGWVSRGEIPDDVLRATTPNLRGKRALVPAGVGASGDDSIGEPTDVSTAD